LLIWLWHFFSNRSREYLVSKKIKYSNIIYSQIISKGSIVLAAEVIMGEMTQNTFSLPITYEMAPKARMIAHYIRSDGEIVSDALTFNVDGIFKNKVSMNK
jgi:archaellum component FlaG (FlaF/FlaG flagellin family)